ncbi:DUF6323 family protein [Enterococcus dispar]|uniref:DUF6323 family protein n=1 Tax=Enterococcus dispar TaxID=44009 RepID=UPI0021D41A82|nr:DUF6323 family protein [Enterococcus dispar]MCU7357379.1 DUF6323 family protein [Enterococcus dispar]
MDFKNDLSLFYSDSSQAIAKLTHDLVRVTKVAGYKLTIKQVTAIYEARNISLMENHLIDFSLENTVQLAEMLLETRLDVNSFVSELQEVTAIFYYLRASENNAYSDEDLIAQIAAVFTHYENDLENTIGYFENHPLLSEGEALWNME